MSVAIPAPSASCAGKFVGGWTVHILATGQTYPAVILPGGTTHVTCPMCNPTATWTCSGDTITIFVNGITVSHTLAAGGRTMSGSGATLTRNGPAPAVATPALQPQANTAEKKLASPDKKKPLADQKAAAIQKQTPLSNMPKSASCSDITGLGGGSGPSNCAPSSGVPPNIQPQINQPQPNMNAPSHVVVLPAPQCRMCDVLTSVGEVLPEFAEKLSNIKLETIVDAEPPLFDGGPNTLHPFLPRRPLAPVSEAEDPVDFLAAMKDLADSSKALSDLIEENNEPEDYAKHCQETFLDTAWKTFTEAGQRWREG
jgi:hypothetical protein